MSKATQDIITDDDRVWVVSQYAVCRTTKVIVDELIEKKEMDDTSENRARIRSLIQTAQPSSARFAIKYKEIYDEVRDAWKRGINDYALYHRSGRIRFYDELLKECRTLLNEAGALDELEKTIKAKTAIIKNMESIASSIRNDGDTFEIEPDANKNDPITQEDIKAAIAGVKNKDAIQ